MGGAGAPVLAQEAEDTTEVKSVSINPPDRRPNLSVQAEMVGLPGDGALEAGEEATLRVAVTNQGEGTARSVEVWAAPKPQRSGLHLEGEAVSDTGAVRLGSAEALAPSTETVFTGTLTAGSEVSGAPGRYSIHVREGNGFGPEDPSLVTVGTEAREPPALELGGFEVASREESQEGQDELLPGTASQVRIQVRNAGLGPAREVEAEVEVGRGGTLLGEVRRAVGTLQPDDTASISVPISAREAGGEVPVRLQLKSSPGAYVTTLEQTVPVATPVDRMIPETDMERPDAVAVVIGIKEYQNQDIPSVEYALRDAEVMRTYLTRTLGFREENIIFAKNATGSKLREIFGTGDNPRGQLYNWVKPGESDVFVYYSGHGAPAPGEDEAYLVASNTNPNYLSINGYPAEQLYENLVEIPARSVTVVLEACFSGVSEDGAVVQRASPVKLSVENPVLAMENGLAFTAGAADQIASWYPEKEHGLFTYFFLKGLRGEADADGNRAVTASEMERYLTEKVPYRARRMFNREQDPQVVSPDKDRVLVQYE